ncbi:MAG: DUF805 domain-containing protein [Synergistaceae bacterium]|nr:DUF805 domain-containing protein [Synergistaceae bacterium]
MDDFISSYKKMFRDCFVFDGRTSRRDFWSALAVNLLVGFLLMLAGLLIHPLGILEYIYGAAVLIPLTAMTVRRLHDTGRSGWWVLLGFVPVLNIILVAFCCFAEGSPGKNSYGHRVY